MEYHMKFINRIEELQLLKKILESKQKEMLVLFGRRRIGKTALLRYISRRQPSLFFACPISTEKESLRLFQSRMAEVLNEPLLRETHFPGWPEALNYGFKACSKKNIPIILDEFPYLLRSVPGIGSIIQNIWDSFEDPIKIILNGSLISIMYNNFFNTTAPLYGRRTYQLHMKPMTFNQIKNFYPNITFDQQLKYYGTFGGIPAYAFRAAQYESYQQAICDLICDSNGIFYYEPELLVKEELRDPNAYFSILHSIASGNTRPHLIAQASGINQASMSKYLDILIKIGIIQRLTPITEKNPERSKKGIYRLADNFLKFWFRYIYPNRSVIDSGMGKELTKSHIIPDLSTYIGFVYEEICHQEIKERGKVLLGWSPFKIGRYWDSNSEIDIIVEDNTGKRVAFIECKLSQKVNVRRLTNKLQQKAVSIPYYYQWEHQYLIISRTKTREDNHYQIG